MGIPSLEAAMNVLMQRSEKQAKVAEDNLTTTTHTQQQIMDASSQLELALAAQRQNEIEESRDVEVAEERLTGGVQGQRLIERLQSRLFQAAELQLNLQEEEANRTGQEKLWDNVIRFGTGSTPGERVVQQLDQEKARIQNTLATLKQSAADAITLFKTNYNSNAAELEAITREAVAKQQGIGVRAQAEATIGAAAANAAAAGTAAADTAATARLRLNAERRQIATDARQERIDRLNEDRLKLAAAEDKLVKKSKEELALAEQQLDMFIMQETGLDKFQVTSMDPGSKTRLGLILQSTKDGVALAPEIVDKSPELRAMLYRQAQRSTPLQMDTWLSGVSSYNDKLVVVPGKKGEIATPRMLKDTEVNLFSYSSPPQIVGADGKAAPDRSAYNTYVAPVLDNAIFGEDPTQSKGVEATQVKILTANPEVQMQLKTPIGRYWETQIATNGGTDEGFLEEARKYPGGMLDLFKLKAALARAASKMIPANYVGHQVEVTVPVTMYETETNLWTQDPTLKPKVVRIPADTTGLLQFQRITKDNEIAEQQFARRKEARDAFTSLLDPNNITRTQGIMNRP